MQIESNQSKLSLGWLLLCIHCEFETNILFLIFFCVCHFFTSPQSCPRCVFNVEFMLLCFLILSVSVLLHTNSLLVCKREKFHFPLSGLTDLLGGKDG